MRYLYIVMAAALFTGAAGEVASAKSSRTKPGDVTGSVRAEWTQTRQTGRAATIVVEAEAERPKYRCATLTCPNFIMIGVGY
jgi:hypothetical protein